MLESDHAPLLWIKTNHSGKLSHWLVAKCGSMTYKIVNRPGKSMTVGDPLSRTPFVQRPTIHLGMETLVSTLLSQLDRKLKTVGLVWVWFDKDTTAAARLVQAWRRETNPLECKAPKPSFIKEGKWEFAIVAPASDRSTQFCSELMLTGKPFACLVPHDLVNTMCSPSTQPRPAAS